MSDATQHSLTLRTSVRCALVVKEYALSVFKIFLCTISYKSKKDFESREGCRGEAQRRSGEERRQTTAEGAEGGAQRKKKKRHTEGCLAAPLLCHVISCLGWPCSLSSLARGRLGPPGALRDRPGRPGAARGGRSTTSARTSQSKLRTLFRVGIGCISRDKFACPRHHGPRSKECVEAMRRQARASVLSLVPSENGSNARDCSLVLPSAIQASFLCEFHKTMDRKRCKRWQLKHTYGTTLRAIR